MAELPAKADMQTPPTAAVMVDADDEKPESNKWPQFYLSLLALVCVVCCAGFFIYSWENFMGALFGIIEDSNSKMTQALVINGMLVLMIVCCLPGPAFCIILDGFFFGFVKGFALGFVAEFIGYLICICLARTCFKTRIRQMMMESAPLREVLLVCEEDSTGKFLVLFRFISLPVWLKNYTIGLLDLEWLQTVLIFIPAEVFYSGIFAYIGSKGRLIADALRKGDSGKAVHAFSGVEVAIVGVSVLCVLLVILFGWYEYIRRRKALTEGTCHESTPLTAEERNAV